MIFIVKVTTNKEEKVIEMVTERVVKKQLSVYSVIRPHGLKGYIILEAADRDSAEECAFNLPYVKGIIRNTVSYEEVKTMLEPKIEDYNIEEGDIVEMIGQTFKGEKAKVIRIDKAKGEVVVSLLGASVPIPVAVKMDSIKVIRREKDDDEEEE
jgi:transcription termination/antitermination protein NusG